MPLPNSFHLTPKVFTHFWSWWALFDGALSLPIRQGNYFPPRALSPKFGRHLATIKYRISTADLFISHSYADDSRDTWTDGTTAFVGIKALIKHFKADLHQRESATPISGSHPDSLKVSRHKPFYAAEVLLEDLDLRTMLSIFGDSLKKSVQITSPPQRCAYRTRDDLPSVDLESCWFDSDDFMDMDWIPSTKPMLHLLPIAACPRFTYFKQSASVTASQSDFSKFGAEDTHTCLLGKGACELPLNHVFPLPKT